jgi:hypothetical protein
VTKQTDTNWVHRAAGLGATFQWQDEGESVAVDYTTILGTLPHKEGEEPIYVVHVQGTADSGHGYSYPIQRYVTVTRKPDGQEVIDEATDAQVQKVSES